MKQKSSSGQSDFRLNTFNRLFLHLLITPVFTLLYAPVNRYVMLPKLGSGAPYVNMAGELVESYFSANTMVRILFYLLTALTLGLTAYRARSFHGWRRVVFVLLSVLGCITAGLIFLEFSVWDTQI